MKVIPALPDEGYSIVTWWRLFQRHRMKVIPASPDEGYSSVTGWRLFQRHQMKVIPEACPAHYFSYIHFYYNETYGCFRSVNISLRIKLNGFGIKKKK
jgi:hypothetical protein